MWQGPKKKVDYCMMKKIHFCYKQIPMLFSNFILLYTLSEDIYMQ